MFAYTLVVQCPSQKRQGRDRERREREDRDGGEKEVRSRDGGQREKERGDEKEQAR